MRTLLVLTVMTALSACAGDPRSYGITGPGTRPAPAAAPMGMDADQVPGVPTYGTFYGPTNTPVTGTSGFWGYN